MPYCWDWAMYRSPMVAHQMGKYGLETLVRRPARTGLLRSPADSSSFNLAVFIARTIPMPIQMRTMAPPTPTMPKTI